MTFNFGNNKGGPGSGPTFGGAAGKKQPAGFIAHLSKVPDPLADVEYKDDLEADSAAELDAVAQGFRSRRDREEVRLKNAIDSEFWFAVCFLTREHKDAFIREMGIDNLGDKYIDGHLLARKLKIDLTLPDEEPDES